MKKKDNKKKRQKSSKKETGKWIVIAGGVASIFTIIGIIHEIFFAHYHIPEETPAFTSIESQNEEEQAEDSQNIEIQGDGQGETHIEEDGIQIFTDAESDSYWLYPNYIYEYYSDWVDMNEVEPYLSAQSNVIIYKERNTFIFNNDESSWDNQGVHVIRGNKQYYDEDMYDRGVVFVALYHNLEDKERTIVKFTVRADNIVEDISPCLIYRRDNFSNEGWGESGPVYISFLEFVPNVDADDTTSVQISLKEGRKTEFEFQSLRPGETIEFDSLLTLDDIEIRGQQFLTDELTCMIRYSVEAPEHNYQDTIEYTLHVTKDSAYIDGGGDGWGGGPTAYGVEIETMYPNWQKTFRTYQNLPAGSTVRIPIFLYPTKSCSMSISIEFETLDGEIITSTPLENARFFVPFYTDEYPLDSLRAYIGGLGEDFSKEYERIIYFPLGRVNAEDDIGNMY